MWQLKTLILLSLILVNQSVKPYHTKFIKFHDKRMIAFTQKFDNNVTLSYTLCDQDDNAPSKECVISLETVTPNGKEPVITCTIQLKREIKYYHKYKQVIIGRDHVIFIWKYDEVNNNNPRGLYYYEELFNARIVRMSNCEFDEIGLTAHQRNFYVDEDAIDNLDVVVYGNDAIEIIFRNENICGKRYWCRTRYDVESRTFSNPPDSFLPINSYDATVKLFPVIVNSSIEAYYQESVFFDDGTITIRDPSMKEVYSYDYTWSFNEMVPRISGLATSHSSNNLGICQQSFEQPYLDCSIFDSAGKGLSGTRILLPDSEYNVLKMHNLKDRGFMLLLGYPPYVPDQGKFSQIDILRIGRYSDLLETHSTSNVKCPDSNSTMEIDFFDKDGHDYCYYVTCSKQRGNDVTLKAFYMKIYIWCYPLKPGRYDQIILT